VCLVTAVLRDRRPDQEAAPLAAGRLRVDARRVPLSRLDVARRGPSGEAVEAAAALARRHRRGDRHERCGEHAADRVVPRSEARVDRVILFGAEAGAEARAEARAAGGGRAEAARAPLRVGLELEQHRRFRGGARPRQQRTDRVFVARRGALQVAQQRHRGNMPLKAEAQHGQSDKRPARFRLDERHVAFAQRRRRPVCNDDNGDVDHRRHRHDRRKRQPRDVWNHANRKADERGDGGEAGAAAQRAQRCDSTGAVGVIGERIGNPERAEQRLYLVRHYVEVRH
jgi:hypothetical protein